MKLYYATLNILNVYFIFYNNCQMKYIHQNISLNQLLKNYILDL